jgi:hypothetical protein
LKVLKMRRNASPDPKMNLLIRVRKKNTGGFFSIFCLIWCLRNY